MPVLRRPVEPAGYHRSEVREGVFGRAAIVLCPFHPEVAIRVGENDAKNPCFTALEASRRVMARAASVKISWRRLCANSQMLPTACALDVRSCLLPITDGPRHQATRIQRH